ncbi:unnamed protein product [Ilex paraguariensis]|uniref:Uncharacterized protein n=1 Tax=Ilex paraguariensis TaxID=185542 RepID=A0ABC8S6U9_9AQUA
MASRPVVQQQNRAEAGPGDVKQKNTAPKGRRALGDIGNLVTIRGVDGKPLPQVSRPVTRFISRLPLPLHVCLLGKYLSYTSL